MALSADDGAKILTFFLINKKVLTTAFAFFSSSVCRDNYHRLCSLFSGYCKDEVYKFVKKHVVDRYRKNCPKTCGKCTPGQKILDVSVYSKYVQIFIIIDRSKETGNFLISAFNI